MTVEQYSLINNDWVGLGYIINDLATRVIGQILAPGSSPTFVGLTLTQLTLINTITEFSTDGTLAGNSDSAVPTEKAVKTYVDALGGVYQPLDAGLTSLAGLTYASDSFIKVTATDTYVIRTLAEVRTDLGCLLADGSVDLTSDWTISADNITLTAGTLTAEHIHSTDDITAAGDINAGGNLAANDNITAGDRIWGGWLRADTFLYLLDSANQKFLKIGAVDNAYTITDNTLTIDLGNTSRILTFTGAIGTHPTIADWFNQSVKTTTAPTFANLTLSGLTQGSVLFAGSGGLISEDNSNLFWDNSNDRLGIGTAIPEVRLHILSSAYPVIRIERTTTTGSSGNFDTSTGLASGFELKTKTTASSVDGFGGGFIFRNEDSSGSSYSVARIYARRDGADNTGAIQFWTGVTGNSPRMTIRASGNVGVGETAPETLTEWTHAQPYLTLHNSTHEDSDGGRESRLNFKGEQSGGEETTLARIEVSHVDDGVDADDEKGKLVISTNTGSDTNTPTDQLMIQDTGDWVINKTSGIGIKVDLSAPTFGWADLLGDQFAKNTGGTKPTLTTYNGVIDAWQFANGDEAFLTYHIPHDYVKGTDIFLHIHWSQNNAGATGGTIDFKYFAIYAKGHNQVSGSTFTSTPITATFSSIDINDGDSGLNQYQQHITEVVISGASATAALFDRDDFEPDGVIELTLEMDATNLTGTPSDPFIHYVDIHYQTTGLIGTKDKVPDFYT